MKSSEIFQKSRQKGRKNGHLHWYWFCIAYFFLHMNAGWCYSPKFSSPVLNLTVARGRDAKFTCKVKHLGGYRVGWVKADTKAIQAIHSHVITHNPRVRVAYDDHSTWHLIIKHVTEDDEGPYMCQINTDPMISQHGYLEIVTPPEINDAYSSSEIVVTEGDSAQMRCVASGNPPPKIMWKREDGAALFARDDLNMSAVYKFTGDVLVLSQVSRDQMGSFMCIANNGVPPQVAKRVILHVHFHPIIHVPNQLIGSPYGRDITLHCNIEASPLPVAFWNNVYGEMVSNSSKYLVFVKLDAYNVKMKLTVRDLNADDVGDYVCIARNSIGKVQSTIKINYIEPVTKPATTTSTTKQILNVPPTKKPSKKKNKTDKNRKKLENEKRKENGKIKVSKNFTGMDEADQFSNHGRRAKVPWVPVFISGASEIFSVYFYVNAALLVRLI